MANWLDGVLSPLGAATKALDTIKGLVEVRDQIKFGAAVSELYGQLMAAYRGAIDAQTHEAAMLEENRGLKDRVSQLEVWEHEEKRYQMKKLPPGVIFYELKPGVEEGELPHYACPTCYQRSKRSILHSKGKAMGLETFHCYECGSDYQTGTPEYPDDDGFDPFSHRNAP